MPSKPSTPATVEAAPMNKDTDNFLVNGMQKISNT
jgi:hypothetical protein